MIDDKDVFMRVDQLGDLFLHDVLSSYIYPRVFVCQDNFESKYLFYEIESEDDYDKWLVTKLTEEDYCDLIDKKKSVQNVYKKAQKSSLCSITKIYGEKDIIQTNNEEVDSLLKFLPSEEIYSEKEISNDMVQNKP